MHFVRDTLPDIEGRREEVTRVAVIGIGQSLRGDDAAGLEAVRRWQEKFPETATRPEIRIEACELPGLTLIDLLNDVETAILVDAVQSSAQPGTIHRLSEEELASFTSGSKSAHGWGVAETLQMRSQLMDEKIKIRIIAIEAEQIELGAGLSKAVENALSTLCKVIEEEIHALL
jgi:hydrogenase maturation protease